MYGNRNEQFGNNTSGGKWYFYNPATLSFGLSEFTKKWGKRKLKTTGEEKQEIYKLLLEDSTALIRKLFKTQKILSFI